MAKPTVKGYTYRLANPAPIKFCVDCGEAIPTPTGRGRPSIRCAGCRIKFQPA